MYVCTYVWTYISWEMMFYFYQPLGLMPWLGIKHLYRLDQDHNQNARPFRPQMTYYFLIVVRMSAQLDC